MFTSRNKAAAVVLIAALAFGLHYPLQPRTSTESVLVASHTTSLSTDRASFVERATRADRRERISADRERRISEKKRKAAAERKRQAAATKSARNHSSSSQAPRREGTSQEAIAYAKSLLPAAQFNCLYQLWTKESGWDPGARGPLNDDGRYPIGIPQLKGLDPNASPRYQVDRGLAYIEHRHGSPCNAWAHYLSVRWY